MKVMITRWKLLLKTPQLCNSGDFQLMEMCASLMWFYGFSNNVAVPRLSVATNAWSFSMSLFLSFRVNSCIQMLSMFWLKRLKQNLKIFLKIKRLFFSSVFLRKEVSTTVVWKHAGKSGCSLPDLTVWRWGSPFPAHSPGLDGSVQCPGHTAMDGLAAGLSGLLHHFHQFAHYQASSHDQ